eukprot:scaffold12939_cov97-Isochrysis_galbana.AAC.5
MCAVLGSPDRLPSLGCTDHLLGQLADDAAKVGAVVGGDLLLERAAPVRGAAVNLLVVEEVGGGVAERYLGGRRESARGGGRSVGARRGWGSRKGRRAAAAAVEAGGTHARTGSSGRAGWEAHKDHAVMGELGEEGEASRLLSAVLRCRREEDARWLPNQSALLPQAAGGVHEGLHLASRHAEAGGQAEHDAVVLGEHVGCCLHVVRLGRRVHLAQDFVGQRLRDAQECHIAARRLESLLDLLGQRTDVAVPAGWQMRRWAASRVRPARGRQAHCYLCADRPCSNGERTRGRRAGLARRGGG